MTLAEYLAAHGYDTAGFVANVDYCSRESGLARGFAHYEDYPIDLNEALTRDIGLGHVIDLSDWTVRWARFWRSAPGVRTT